MFSDHPSQLATCLDIATAISSPGEWHVIAIESSGLLFLADSRPEATTMILEAVAANHGEVVESGGKAKTEEAVLGNASFEM